MALVEKETEPGYVEVVINDIPLRIPPQQIGVRKEAHNNEWQTLRTASSQKSKSGHSMVTVTLEVIFEGSGDRANSLVPLVAGLRATPFCVVYSEYLESILMNTDKGHGDSASYSQYKQFRPMAFVISNMSFSTMGHVGMPDCISGTFTFLWFNYFPYTPIFAFKTGENHTSPGYPWDSESWKAFYRPFLLKAKFPEWPHDTESGLTTASFQYREFALLPQGDALSNEATEDLLQTLKNNPVAFLKEYQALQKDKVNISNQNIYDSLYRNLIHKNLNVNSEMRNQIDAFQKGSITSSATSVLAPLMDRLSSTAGTLGIDTAAQSVNGSEQQIIDSSIGLVRKRMKALQGMNDEETFNEAGDRADVSEFKRLTKFNMKEISGGTASIIGGLALMGRKRQFNIIPSGEEKGTKTVIEQIVISFQNITAMIPMASYRYPTCQHIGSIDAEVTFVINTSSQGVYDISKMYDTIETMALEFRQIPQGFLNLFVQNDFLGLFGVDEFLTNRIEATTIPDQPGRSRIVLSLTEAGLSSTTKVQDSPEQLQQEYIKRDASLYEEVWKVLDTYLREEGAKTRKTGGLIGLFVSDKPNSATSIDYYTLERYNISNADSNAALIDILDRARYYYNEFIKTVFYEVFHGDDAYMENFGHVAMNNVLSVKNNTSYGFIPGWERIQDAVRRYNTESKKFKVRSTDIPTWTRRHSPLRDAMGTFKPADVATTMGEIGLSEYQIKQRNLLQEVLDTYLTLTPALQKIANMQEDMGLGRGLIAYPDFRQQLQSIASLDLDRTQDKTDQLHAIFFQQSIALPKSAVNNEVKLMNYEPDAYIWYPMYDGGNNTIDTLIDPQWMIAAENLSKESAKNAQKKAAAFYGNEYLKNLTGNVLKEQEKVAQLLPPIYLNQSWENCTQTEEIKLDVILDAYAKIHSNWPDKKNPQIVSFNNATITHSTSMDELWGGLKAGTNPSSGPGASGDKPPINNRPDVPSNPTKSSGQRLGIVEGVKISWPRPNSFLEPRIMYGGDFYCPIAKYKNLSHKNHPCKIRDIGKTESGFHYRQKNAAIDWMTSSNILIKKKWSSPVEAEKTKGKPISQWTYQEYKDWKSQTGKKIGYIHKGVDVNCDVGVDVYACLDGVIKYLGYSKNGAGLFIEINHDNTQIGQSRYLHLQEYDPSLRIGQKVKGGQCIAVAGRSGQKMMSPHLHFETWDKPVPPGKRAYQIGAKIRDPVNDTSIPWNTGTGSPLARPKVPGKSQEKIDSINTQYTQTDVTSVAESPLKLSIQEFEKDMLRGQAQSLLRAYPTFKLYFIEDDSGERKRLQFDDFFSYNAVKSIRVIRSRKIAADLCEIVLTNVSGVLTNRKYRHEEWNEQGPTADRARDAAGKIINESTVATEADTKKENPMASFLLQEGTNISLRLGFSNDPDRLETVFNGVILEVEISDSDDLIRIVAQSYAVELVQDIKGLEDAETLSSRSFFGWNAWGFLDNAGTGRILENMMAQPEVLHFGRWSPTTGGGTANRELLTNKWTLNPTPQDDNIFAPTSNIEISNGIFFKDLKYTIYQTTIWDIFKEMELRHPNFIASPVPYKDKTGERMTMFFGMPNQLYFARSPTSKEQSAQEVLKKALEGQKDAATMATYSYLLQKQRKEADKDSSIWSAGWKAITGQSSSPSYPKAEALIGNAIRESRLELAKKAGYIRPFRNYHLITASQHIISNNIRTTARDIYNTIAIKYGDATTVNGQAAVSNAEMFTLKLDAALPTEEIRTMVTVQLNASNKELAKRYALSLMSQNLKEIYQGDITIIGNPKMKPYDIVYLFDDYSDMIGPVEIEQVTHIFDQDQGFRTEIKPNMLVQAAEWSLLNCCEAMGVVFEGVIKKWSIRNWLRKKCAPAANMLDQSANDLGYGFGLFGGFLATKLLNYTQLTSPMVMTPLIHHGRIFAGGVPTRKLPFSVWRTIRGDWSPAGDASYADWKSSIYEEIGGALGTAFGRHTVGDFWRNDRFYNTLQSR